MTLILPHKVSVIDAPYIVVCEGFGDACLVAKLLEHRAIQNCRVGCPSRAGVGGEGKDFLDKYLDAIALVAANQTTRILRGILVMVDADDDPGKAFDLACEALTFAEFPAPDAQFALHQVGDLRTAVYLVPGLGETGTLEHLLLLSALEKAPASGVCVDAFLGCVGKTPANEPNVLAKMKMSALVAASNPRNPWATPGPLLQSSKSNLIPIDSPHFKHLGDFLAEFCAK